MAKGTGRDSAESNAPKIADALHEVSVEHGATSPVDEFQRLEEVRQAQQLQDQGTADHPVDVNDPTGAHQGSPQELAEQWLRSHEGEGTAADGGQTSGTGTTVGTSSATSGVTGSPASSQLQSAQDLWNQFTHSGGDDQQADKSLDPGVHPRDVLAGFENRFGSPFDRLDKGATESTDDPNPYSSVDTRSVADGELGKAADFLHNQGVNPSPAVTGDPKTPISQAAQDAKLDDDISSGRATRYTSHDGVVSVVKNNDGTTVVDDTSNNTRTTQKPDGTIITQDLKTGKVIDETKPSTKTPDQDHETVLPKNFHKGQFDADGHVEMARQFQHSHDPTNVDPTDQDPAATAAPVRSGPIHDAKTELLVGPGQPGHDPSSPDFGGGAGQLPAQGSLPSDPNHGLATDPGEQAETGPPQETGPSVRVHHNPTPAVEGGSARPHSGSGQASTTPDEHGGAAGHSGGGPVLTNPHVPHVEVPDHTSTPSRESPVARSAHQPASDPAVPQPHPAPPPDHGAEVGHEAIGQHPILPDPSVPDPHVAIHPTPATGEALHDQVAHHPILPEPAVPEAHHVEVPPPAHGEEATLDPGSHHPIPEPEDHHLDFHFPG